MPDGAFDSGLTIPDFAACLQMGLQPLGLAQGFFCGQVSARSGIQASVVEAYSCRHYPEQHMNPGWVGVLDQLDAVWQQGYQVALGRLVQEAASKGAHGVVGVKTRLSHPTHEGTFEVHLLGTAVAIEGVAPPPAVWCTHIAGHKLAKLVEIGYAPATLVFARCTGVLNDGCTMENYENAMYRATGTVVEPITTVHTVAREYALRSARQQVGDDSLFDVSTTVHEREDAGGTHVICTITGSRVRHVAAADRLAVPVPAVSLS